MNKIKDFFNYPIHLGDNIEFTAKAIVILLLVFFFTRLFLKLVKRIIIKNLSENAKYRFESIFTFFNYFIYIIVILATFDNIGVNVTAIFAASAALLVGVGLALQTFIQDIISGIFIIADQAVHVGDIIEIEGQSGKVESIALRTTRVVTVNNKVLIIPNHKFLTSILYNWTENGIITREFIQVGVSYASDVEHVRALLLQVGNDHRAVLNTPKPEVMLIDFGDNAVIFRLYFSINNSFRAEKVKSDVRFSIWKSFQENNIEIPFPQRQVWINHSEEISANG